MATIKSKSKLEIKVREHLEVFEECQEPGRVNTFFSSADENDDDNCVDDDDTCLTRWRGLASWSKTQKHSRSMSLPCQPETHLQTWCYRQSLKIMSLRHIQCISPNIFQNKFIFGKLIGVYANLTCIWQSGLTHIYNIGLVVCVHCPIWVFTYLQLNIMITCQYLIKKFSS